jgi:hypothetical protein
MSISKNPVRGLVTTIRDELRERREARARYDDLKRELDSYRTPREVDDLLGVVMNQEGPEAEEIRGILLDNLRQPMSTLHRVA